MAEWAMLTLGAPCEDGAVLTGAGLPVLGRIDVQALSAVARRVAALRPAAGLLRREPTHVAPLVTEMHAALLGGPEMRGIGLAMARLCGAAAPDRPVLVLDLRTEALADVPWELLDDRYHVVRHAPGGAPRPPAPALEVVTWVPDPTEEACRAILSVAGGVEGCSLIGLAGEVIPPPTATRVLLVIAHGRADQERVLTQLGAAASAEADSVGRWLRPVLDTCALVVLCTCHGGRLADGPAARLAASGVPVVAPRWTLAVDAASGLVSGLLGALVAGASLRAAVAEARRRILGLHRPVPDAWWWNLSLYASPEQAAADMPLVRPAPRPTDWPIGAPEAQLVVEAALRGARGWVGVESLARALEREAGLGAVAGRLAPFLLDLPALPGAVAPTPAVSRIGRSLRPGFALAALYDSVLTELPFEMGAPLVSEGGSTTRAGTARVSIDEFPEGALVVEVLTGPDGGRRFGIAVGETLGRDANPARATHLLYVGAPVADGKLSRCHLRCEPAGRVTNLTAEGTVLVLAGDGVRQAIPPGGSGRVQRGDALRLGSTWLLVVAAQSEPSQS